MLCFSLTLAARLVKHTGYGNAAGLLMSHGLLGGGRSEHQSDYSSDSDTSDTEEYHVSKDRYVQYYTGHATSLYKLLRDHYYCERSESVC